MQYSSHVTIFVSWSTMAPNYKVDVLLCDNILMSPLSWYDLNIVSPVERTMYSKEFSSLEMWLIKYSPWDWVHKTLPCENVFWSYNILLLQYCNICAVLIGLVFANGPGDLGSIPSHVILKTLKMVLDTSLLNTQQYKVHIKGKVEQSRERSSTLPYTSV